MSSPPAPSPPPHQSLPRLHPCPITSPNGSFLFYPPPPCSTPGSRRTAIPQGFRPLPCPRSPRSGVSPGLASLPAPQCLARDLARGRTTELANFEPLWGKHIATSPFHPSAHTWSADTSQRPSGSQSQVPGHSVSAVARHCLLALSGPASRSRQLPQTELRTKGVLWL